MRNSFGGVLPYSAPWPHPALCWRALPNSKHLTRATLLPQIRVPTLVIARTGLAPGAFARARYIADHIARAEFVELPGSDVAPFYETPELILDNIEEFIKSLE